MRTYNLVCDAQHFYFSEGPLPPAWWCDSSVALHSKSVALQLPYTPEQPPESSPYGRPFANIVPFTFCVYSLKHSARFIALYFWSYAASDLILDAAWKRSFKDLLLLPPHTRVVLFIHYCSRCVTPIFAKRVMGDILIKQIIHVCYRCDMTVLSLFNMQFWLHKNAIFGTVFTICHCA